MTSLNPEQTQAVEHEEGPLLVLAGAGAGKTRIVTARIARLIDKGIAPSHILAVTFTNKAAGEMQERVHGLCSQKVLICTFHSLGARILRQSISALGYLPDFTIYDEEDADKTLRSCLKQLGVKKELKPKVFRGMISDAKNRLVPPEDLDLKELDTEAEQAFPEVYALYQAKLKESNALDFDDLLFLTVRLFQECPEVLSHYQMRWSFLLIDEYQDTNRAQYLMAKMLVDETKNLFVVGDPDQSIYSWRGANIENILNFEEDYPGAKVVRLEQNYRSTNTILGAANALIANNNGRYQKELWSELGEGEPIRLLRHMSDRDEASGIVDFLDAHHCNEGIPLSEMVVFYRTNFQSRQFEDALLRRRIPYVIVGGISFYQRREIKDILAYLRVVDTGMDFISFSRTINIPKRGLGEATLEKLRAGATEAGVPIIEYCRYPEVRLNAKQRDGLADYIRLIDKLRSAKEEGLFHLVSEAVHESGYLRYLRDDPETFDDRKANVEELIGKAAEWQDTTDEPTLTGFLEELSLKSSLDEASTDEERVSLMTLHNGKGLEFAVTFIAGLEEGLFPHGSSIGTREGLEEERRLCYVGVTRAKKQLYLSCASSRFIWGSPQMMRPSRFLKEIPPKFMAKGSKTVDTFVEKVEFEEGDYVVHQDFGPGRIEQISQNNLGLIYKVLFTRDDERRTLVAKYAKLQRYSA